MDLYDFSSRRPGDDLVGLAELLVGDLLAYVTPLVACGGMGASPDEPNYWARFPGFGKPIPAQVYGALRIHPHLVAFRRAGLTHFLLWECAPPVDRVYGNRQGYLRQRRYLVIGYGRDETGFVRRRMIRPDLIYDGRFEAPAPDASLEPRQMNGASMGGA